MPDLKMSDPEYWEMPEKFRIINERLQGGRLSFHLLGPDKPETPVCVMLELYPGRIITRHAHDSERFEVICKGRLETQNGRTYEAGDVMVAGSGEMYGPKVAGPEGAVTCEVFANQIGATEVLLELIDGSQSHLYLLDGDMPPPDFADLAGLDWALGRSREIQASLAPA